MAIQFKTAWAQRGFTRLLGSLGILLMLTAGGADAGQVSLTLDPNFPSDYLFYTYTDGTSNAHTVPIGPYPAALAGGGYTSSTTEYIWCLDFNIDTFAGVTYSGSIVAPSTETEIETAYLEDQVFALGGYSGDVNQIGPYAMAVWQLMNASSFNPAAFALDPAAQALINQAVTAYTTGAWTQADAAQYAIWIADDISGSQRFGLLAPPPPVQLFATPEPGAFALVGMGLLAIGTYGRRRRAKSV